jgi:uncharacterized protein
MLKKSLYTYIFKRDNKYYLYNSQTSYFSEITKELYDIISDRDWEKLPANVISEMKEKTILVEESDIYNFYNARKLKFLSSCYDTRSLNLVIAPTTACNFACPYCFEPKKTPKTITDATISSIIDFINGHKGANDLSITWYGGEPLLAFAKMKTILSLINERTNINIVSHTIVTNGYLINQEIINFFNSSKINRIQITLDGIEEHHNTTRCLKSDKGPTFDTIIKNIELVAKECPDTILDIRVNINKENFNDFVTIYKLYKNQYKNIHVYPGFIREDTPDGCSLCHRSFKIDERFHLYDYISKNGIDVSFFPRNRGKGCMINQLNSFIIGPEGELYKCWNDVSNPNKVIGNINSTELMNSSIYLRYMNDTMPFDEKCKKCMIFPVCGGGCGYYRYKNLYEEGQYDYCSVFSNLNNLESALIRYSDTKNKRGKNNLTIH